MRHVLLFICLLSFCSTTAQVSYLAYANTRNPRNSEGDIIRLNDTTYMLAFSQFYDYPDDFAESTIHSLISTDKGISWADNGQLQGNAGIQTTNSASLLRCPNNDILLFFLVGNSLTDLKSYVRRSTDNGATFGTMVQVTDSAGYWVMNNARAMLTSSGRIVLPFAYSPNAAQSFGTDPIHPYRARCLYSDDNGVTWNRSNGWITAPMRGAMEPGIVELSPGNLLMYIRTQTGNQYYSTSSDNGTNWAAATASTLVSPESPATIINHDGTLIAIYNNNYDPDDMVKFGDRTPLTISTSVDNGATWTVVMNIEDRLSHSFAYTSAMVHDGYLVLSYWDSINNNASLSLKFRKILLSELGL